MAGLTKASEGYITWKGVEQRPRELTNKIGVVMQDPEPYFLGKTVLDELIMWRDDKTPDDVRRVMSMVGLNHVSLLKPPSKLSGGQKKRLALASQLMRDPLPELFVMDEPFAGVDAIAQKQLVEVIGSLKKRFAIVIVTHEPGELLDLANRIVHIAKKTAIEVPRDVIERAKRVRKQNRKLLRESIKREKQQFQSKKESPS